MNTTTVNTILKMTTFEDVGELYVKYQNDNGTQTEVDFYKNQLQKSFEEMDNLRQENLKQNVLVTEKKSDTDEVVILKVREKRLTEKVTVLHTKNLSLEEEIKCDEWWCPKHSDFNEILKKISLKEQSLEDRYLVRKAKARHTYWQGEKNKNTPRCPMQDNKKAHLITTKYHLFGRVHFNNTNL
ncbi:hypothetical protein ACI65C_005382 [Semiaphis heraclei]